MGERREDSGERGWDPAALEFSALSRVRLDLLLRELLERFGDVLQAQQRLHALLPAIVSLGSDLDVSAVLGRVAETTARLLETEYAAVAVMGQHQHTAEFVTYGLADAERTAIRRNPQAEAVLDRLIEDRRRIRVKQMTEDPLLREIAGDCPWDGTFLGVPVHVRDRAFGYLAAADKRGAKMFTEEDEEIAIALAAAAAVAIENARLYALTDRRRRWLQATGEISESLLSPVDRTESLRLIVRRAREVSGCDVAAVLLESGDDLVFEVADGFAAADLEGARVPLGRGVVAQVVNTGRPIVVADFAKDRRVEWPSGPAGAALRKAGVVAFVPFRAGTGVSGALGIAWRHDSEAGPVEDDLELVQNFAVHAALALEQARSQEDRQLIALLEDRDRIARDLHDHVIQRLFAIGMELQGASRLAPRAEVRDRILGAVDDLDSTIDEIRGSIFDLRRRPGATDLRSEIHDEAKNAAPALGFAPHVVIRGPARHLVDDTVRPHLIAAVREGLANVARHARATRAGVLLTVDSDLIELRVEDDGRGVGSATRRSGLANLTARAEQLGGTCELHPRRGGGTTLMWRVPRPRTRRRAAGPQRQSSAPEPKTTGTAEES